jgi:catechol 2,3-dioxygenase-like lactoylglutathione lyase family enzyme
MLQTGVKVTSLDHVVLYVEDLARAKRFYTELLGMEVRVEHGDRVFLRCGRQQVGLFTKEDGSGAHAGEEINHIALRVENGEWPEVKAALEAAGVAVSSRPNDPTCIYIDDPDGHMVQIVTADRQR